MKTSIPLRYHLFIYRREQLWLPLGLWGLFAILGVLMGGDAKRAFDIADAFLGFVLPMLAGILAASAVVDDPALELQLAAPRAPWRTLLERLALLLAIVAVLAVTYQVYLAVMGVSIAALGNLAVRQFVWLLPSVTLMGLASLASLGMVQGTGGALAAGVIWLLQLILRDWFVASPWARYTFLFMAARWPTHPSLHLNQLCLLGLGIILVAAAALLLKKEERYL